MMIKVCELVKRRPDMTVEAFQAYWRDTHGPIVSRIPGIKRYVQSHPLLGGYRRGPLPYDGIAEVWVENKEVLREFPTHEAFRAAKQDEPNFIETEALIELVMDEHVIVDGTAPSDAIKSIALVRFRDGLSPVEGQTYWRQHHSSVAVAIPGLRRYVQSHVRLGAYQRELLPSCDGLAITWFDSTDAMRAAARSDAYQRTRDDEPNFIVPGEVPTLLTRELVFVA